jgi:glycosyltransferase involved in cell wall biosynthesis
MTDAKRPTVISLCYHEITADPRVMKEAQALQAGGYDVHVFCDWPDGRPEYEEIDGLKITRFKVYSSGNISATDLDLFPFLQRSRAALTHRFLPYAEAAESLRAYKPMLEERFGPDVLARTQSSYYKSVSGAERSRRYRAFLRLSLGIYVMGFLGMLRPGHKPPGRLPLWKAMWQRSRSRKSQFQAEAVLLAANLTRIAECPKAAAVHAHDIYCLIAGAWLSRKLGVPLVYDAHEYEPGRATKTDQGEENLAALIEEDCFGDVARMVTVSEGIADLYSARFPGPRPALVMNAPAFRARDGAVGPDLPPGLTGLRALARLDTDTPLMVFTGGAQRSNRGLDKVLEAMRDLPGYHFANLGPRDELFDGWLMKRAEQNRVAERIHLLPPVPARDVPATIASADMAVIPIQDVSLSYRHAMPNKLFEAAYAGLPICVSDLPDMRSFVEEFGIGRAMNQTDPTNIAAVLRDVMENRARYMPTPEVYARMVRDYGWQTQADRLCAVFDDLLGGPAA